MADEGAPVASRGPPPLPPNHPSTRKPANPRPPPPKPPPHGSNTPSAPTPYTKTVKPPNPSVHNANADITIISAQPITKTQPFHLVSRPIETDVGGGDQVLPPRSKAKASTSKPIPPKPANYINFEIPASDDKQATEEDLPSRPSAPPNFAKKEEKQPNRPTSPPSDIFLSNILDKSTKQNVETDVPRKPPSPARNPPPLRPVLPLPDPTVPVTNETDSNKAAPEIQPPAALPRKLSARKAPPPPIAKHSSPKTTPQEPAIVNTGTTVGPGSTKPTPKRPVAPVAKLENSPAKPPVPISNTDSPQREKLPPPKPQQPSVAPQVKIPPPKPVGPPSKPSRPENPKQQVAPPARHHDPTKIGAKQTAPALPPRPEPGHPLYKYVCTEPHGFSTTHFPSTQPDVLSLSKGEFLMLLERLDKHWYFCANEGDEEGLVLVSNVKVIRKLPDEDGQMISDDKPFAVARSDYLSGVEGDLNFSKGDVIFLIKYLSKDWMEGECEKSHARGMFPKVHVEIVTDLEEGPPDPADSMEGPRAKVIFDFLGDQSGDLPLSKGGMVYLLEKLGNGWYKGILPTGGDEGIFPETFIEIVEPLPEVAVVEEQKPEPITPIVTSEPAKSDTGYSGKAIYDFPGSSEGDLAFKTGDVITNITTLSDEWLQGELKGKEGIFPANFIEKIQDSPPETLKTPRKVDPLKNVTQLNDDLLPRAKALFDYNEGIDGDLIFEAGQIIDLLEKLNDDWYQGELNGMVGNFPASFVEVLTPLP